MRCLVHCSSISGRNYAAHPDRRLRRNVARGRCQGPGYGPGKQAQDYPTRPVRLIVAFTPGGTTDITARLIADKMQRLLGAAVAVENKPGANGAIAAQYVAQAEPDGYTLFFSTVGAVAINPAFRSDLSYDPLKDFAPVGKAAVNSADAGGERRYEGRFGARARRTGPQKARRHHHRHYRPRRHVGSRPAIVRGRGRHSAAVGALSRRRARPLPTFSPAISTAWSATCRR